MKRAALVLLGVFAIIVCSTPAYAEKKQTATYVEMRPPFVTNYGGRGKLKYLKAEVSLRVNSRQKEKLIKANMPLLRNGMVLLLSSQTDQVLASVQGKEGLRQEALVALRQIMEGEVGNGCIDDLLFTSFVIQK